MADETPYLLFMASALCDLLETQSGFQLGAEILFPRHSNDNGLVETKNGAVIRKHMGYGHIAAAHAEAIARFYREYLNPYVNLHRPRAKADVEIDAKGRKRLVTGDMKLRWKLQLSREKPEHFL